MPDIRRRARWTASSGRCPDSEIFGEEINVRAHIETIEGISGHADRDWPDHLDFLFEERPKYVFVVHGSESSCVAFTDALTTQLGLKAKAPFSGSQFDLLRGCWIKETEGVPVDKETAGRRKATGVYTRLVDAGKLLMEVIPTTRAEQTGILRNLQSRFLRSAKNGQIGRAAYDKRENIYGRLSQGKS